MDPEHMNKREFVKFCRDSLIIPRPNSKDPFLTTEQKNRIEMSKLLLEQIVSRHSNFVENMLSTAEVHVIYTSVIRRLKRTTHKEKMNYNDFLNALMKISIEMYVSWNSEEIDVFFTHIYLSFLLFYILFLIPFYSPFSLSLSLRAIYNFSKFLTHPLNSPHAGTERRKVYHLSKTHFKLF